MDERSLLPFQLISPRPLLCGYKIKLCYDVLMVWGLLSSTLSFNILPPHLVCIPAPSYTLTRSPHLSHAMHVHICLHSVHLYLGCFLCLFDFLVKSHHPFCLHKLNHHWIKPSNPLTATQSHAASAFESPIEDSRLAR